MIPRFVLVLLLAISGTHAWNLHITPNEDDLIRPTGKNVYVVCQVEFEEGETEAAAIVQWLKDGERVNPFNVRSNRKVHNKYQKTLFLNNPSLDQSGDYKCHAKIGDDEHEKAVTINFKEAAKFVNTPAEQHPEDGADARIKCNVEGYDVEVDWLFNGSAVEEIVSRTYDFEDDGQTLIIPEFKADEDNGIYTCRWQQFATFGSLDINVVAHSKPKILLYPSQGNNTAYEGQSADFQCQAAGKPKPSIRWFQFNKDGTETELFSSDKYNSTDGILRIRKVSLDDAGRYMCLAENEQGKDSKEVDIRVISNPKIDQMSDITLEEGKEATFQCTFHGEGSLNAQWVHKGETLASQEFESSEDHHTLNYTITGVTAEEHMGAYTCEVKNEAGVSSKAMQLKVYHAPEITLHNDSFKFVAVESDIELVCGTSAIPLPTWQWSLNGAPLSQNIKVDNYENGTSVLRIDNFPEELFGQYVCEATNEYGSDKHEVELIRQEVPHAPVLKCLETPETDAIHCIDENEVNKGEPDANSPESYIVYYMQQSELAQEESQEKERNEVEFGQELDEEKGEITGHPVSIEVSDEVDNLLAKGYDIKSVPYAAGHIWLKNLEPGTKYVIQVVGRNGAGQSELSNEVEHETTSDHEGFVLPSWIRIPMLVVIVLLVIGVDLLCCVCRNRGVMAAICRKCCRRNNSKQSGHEGQHMLVDEETGIEKPIIKGSYKGPASSNV